MRIVGALRARRLLLVAVVTVFVLPVASASASGGLITQAATGVGIVSATLNATTSGTFSGTGWCSFAYESANSQSSIVTNAPAQQCNKGAYSITESGLLAGTQYWYWAVECATVTTSNNVTYCTGSSAALLDPCANAHTCPTFTTGVPTGTTEAASSVLGTSATLNATLQIEDLTSQSENVVYHFDYSTDPGLAAATSTPNTTLPLDNTSSDPGVTVPVSGLTSDTTYYYRVVVWDTEAGAVTPYDGNILSFTTGGFVRTGAASGVTTGAAVLNGEVDGGDAALSYSWLYSTSSATTGGVLSSGTTSVAGGSVTAGGVQNVSASLGGLAPDTTYYFQLVTTDPSIYGQVVSFFTLPGYCGASASPLTDSPIPSTGFLVTGCWSSANGVYTGYGSVHVNGVTFSGPSSGTVTIDTTNDTIATSTPYDVDVGSVRMYSGALSGAISKDFVDSTGTATSCTGGTNSAFDLGATDSSQTLYDLPLGGFARMTACSTGGSTVEISALGLPSLFGGVTADGSVGVDESGSVNTVHAQLGDSTIGPMTLPGFTLDGDPQTNTWSGDVNLMFPLAKAGFTAEVQIEDGKLNGLGASVSGLDIALGDSGLFLDGGGFSTVFSPLTLQGDLDVSFGPKFAGVDLMDIDAGFYAGFNQDQTLNGLPGLVDGTVLHDVPFTLGINGTLNLLGFIQLESTNYDYYGVPGLPFVAMHSTLAEPLNVSCGPLGPYGVGYSPSLALAGDARGTQFNLVGSGGAALDLCAFQIKVSVTAALSSTGIGICGAFDDNSVGAGFTWPSTVSSFSQLLSHFTLYKTGCDISNYETTITSLDSARTSAAAALTRAPVGLPGGLPFAVIRVKGRGAPPLLRVGEPGRGAIVMRTLKGVTVARARYLVIPDVANDTTYVELTRPLAGRYQVEAQPGSAPIVSVSVAQGEPSPRVTARLGRRGNGRVLTWHAVRLPGQRLTFREVGGAGDRVLVSTTKATGRFAFRPLPGLAGARSILVDVYEHGMLSKVFHLARYTGPVITRPGSARRLTVTRQGTTLTIRWQRAAGSVDHYLAIVGTSDGRRQLYITRSLHLTLHGTPAKGPVRASVTAVDVLGLRGPSTSSALTRRHRRR